jgi:tetratricopeptide (TPR) repeat protein
MKRPFFPLSLSLAAVVAQVAALAPAAPVADEPNRIHWVQVAEFAEEASAEAQAEVVRAMGYSPVCVYPSSSGPTVRVGEFAIHMDAFLAFEDLQEVFPGARLRYNSLREEREASREWAFQSLSAPPGAHEIFALSARPLSPEGPLRFDNESCALLDGSMRVASRLPVDQRRIEVQAENLIDFASQSPDDTDVAEGSMMLADLCARAGEYQRARELALPTADGTLTASPQARYDAMWLMARVYHAMDWRRTAYRAYGEIESVATDALDILRCRAERAGLLLELSESGTGRLVDCRLACSQILRDFADLDDSLANQLRATAALMRAETFYLENDFERSATELQAVADGSQDVPRVQGMALYYLGYALHRAGRSAESTETFERLARLHLPLADNFPTFDVSPMAYRNLIVSAHRTHSFARAEEYFMELMQFHPDSEFVPECAEQLNFFRGALTEECRTLVESVLSE